MRGFPHGLRARLARDWRFRTLVPVVVINLLAFAILYGLMYHFAVSNLVKTEKAAGAVLLDEIEFNLPDMMRDHTGQILRARMAREAAMHNLTDVNLFDARARAVLTTYGEPSGAVASAVRSTLTTGTEETQWIVAPGARTLLVGIRPLFNRAECTQCHAHSADRLGALQMSIDLTEPMIENGRRVRSRFALAGAAWVALLALMFWTGGVVIGRPLKKIQKSLTGTDAADASGQDLEALASRVHETIWKLIERQRQREDDIARHMARAEQLASLGEVAAGLTHEIKNPLSGVIGALEVCRSEFENNQEIVDQMIGELRRVTTTLDSLLRLARPPQPQIADVDLARTVRDLTSIFSARFGRQGVELDVECSEATPTVPLDAGLMAQLVINLLTNSLQATERGGTVRVIVAPFPRRDGVVLAVSDTGRGIAPENLERVFDPFFTTKEEGTGLGLAICRQIVEQHGGTITIESELGKGTRVVALFPAKRAERTEESDGFAAAG